MKAKTDFLSLHFKKRCNTKEIPENPKLDIKLVLTIG